METTELPVYKRSLFSWVLSGSVKLQLLMVCIILITVFLRVLPLEMQKRIVNQAIKLKEVNLLVLYCGIYVSAVIVASGLKFIVNIIQTHLAQQTTAEMRNALYQHILTLPLHFFRKTQPGMVVSTLVTELSTVGDFIGTTPSPSMPSRRKTAALMIWMRMWRSKAYPS